jgi:hypothetical protein
MHEPAPNAFAQTPSTPHVHRLSLYGADLGTRRVLRLSCNFGVVLG